MGGMGKSNQYPEQLGDIANSLWKTVKQPVGKASNLLSSTITGGPLGMTGPILPLISKAVESSKAASQQTLTQAGEGMARTGMSGTPYGENILFNLMQQGGQQASQIPIDLATGFYQFIMQLLSPLVFGQTGVVTQGLGSAGQAQAQENAGLMGLIGSMFGQQGIMGSTTQMGEGISKLFGKGTPAPTK